jgi:hypothetical protein
VPESVKSILLIETVRTASRLQLLDRNGMSQIWYAVTLPDQRRPREGSSRLVQAPRRTPCRRCPAAVGSRSNPECLDARPTIKPPARPSRIGVNCVWRVQVHADIAGSPPRGTDTTVSPSQSRRHHKRQHLSPAFDQQLQFDHRMRQRRGWKPA